MSYLEYVNIKQGTESLPRFSHGNTLPLIQMPFGMNAYAPQTSGDRASGEEGNWFYHPKDRSLEGIRLTHQPSPWIGDYTPLVMMPQREEPIGKPMRRWSGYKPQDTELRPHYLKTEFLRYEAIFELAPTTRGGIARVSYHGLNDRSFAIFCDRGKAWFQADYERNAIVGFTQFSYSGCQTDGFGMYFVYQFDCLLDKDRTYIFHTDGSAEPGSYVNEDTCGISVGVTGCRVTVRFATSFISVEQAWITLKREVTGRGFDQIKDIAGQTWETYLSRIEIESDDENQLRLFYSCMYRVFLFPTKFYETDGQGNKIHYCADTGKVRPGVKYLNNGFWDTYRTIYPLYSLIAEDEFAEMLEGYVNTYKDCGWLPKWPSPNEVGMMPGTLIDAVIAEAATKGIGSRKLIQDALEGVLKHATEESTDSKYGRHGVRAYNQYGYLPSDMYCESVSNTLDYIYGDFCIAQIAKSVGDMDLYYKHMETSKNYVKLFDKETGFMRGRDREGNMSDDFDEFRWGGDYCEGGPWQSSFAVYHDIEGLAALHGGKDQLMEKIDRLFATKPNYRVGTYAREIHEMTEMAAADFGQCAISNQPSFHIPYIYAALGNKEKTQYWVERLLKHGFSARDDGFPGDEDNGTMAAWVVFSMLGIYPFCPGKPEYLRINPMVDRAIIHTKYNDYVITPEENDERIIRHEDIVKRNYDYDMKEKKHGGKASVFQKNREKNISWNTVGDDDGDRRWDDFSKRGAS